MPDMCRYVPVYAGSNIDGYQYNCTYKGVHTDMSLAWSTHNNEPDNEPDGNRTNAGKPINTGVNTITTVDNPTNEQAYWECAMSEFMTQFGRRPVDGKEFSQVALRAQAIKLASVKL
jgi:hypothetical protein